VLVEGTLYVAGQLGRDAKTGDYPSDFQDEVRQCLERVGLVLGAAGMDFSDVLSVQVFLTDVTQFSQMNAVYETFFTRPPLPARTTVGASALPGGKARIEVSVIARK
jgi:2-iminobutanoate/2-iminopropanoate deaminase